MRKRAKNEMKGVTFSPILNSKSVDMFNNSNNISVVEDRLLTYKNERQEKLIKERTRKIIQDHEQHTFRPEVNEKSRILASIVKKTREDFMKKFKSEDNLNKSEILDKSHTLSLDDKNEESKQNQINNINAQNYKSSVVSESFSNMAKLDKTSRSKTPTRNENTLYSNKNKILKKSEALNNLTIRSNNSKSTNNLNSSSKSPLSKTNNKMVYVPKHKTLIKKQAVNFNKTSSTIHDFLYDERKIQPLKKKQNEQFWDKQVQPFTPYIPDNVRELYPKRVETTSEFINRLHNTKNTTDEIIIEVKKKQVLDNSINRITGQELYKPKICRGPLNPNKRQENFDIDKFYNQKLIEDNNKLHEEEILNNLEKKKHYLELSMKSVLKMKIEKYKEIFHLLDSDQDGFISSRNIKLSNLNSDILETLTPVLEDLQKNEKKMNFKEFCLCADRYLSPKIFSISN